MIGQAVDRDIKRYIPLAVVASVVLIVVAAVGYRLLKPKPAKAPKRFAQVKITATGFEPASLIVKSGTEVTWTNQSAKARRVASNPHPEHTGLPGFDSKRPIGPDGEYAFVFTKIGKFNYHDDLNPLVNGQIEVKN